MSNKKNWYARVDDILESILVIEESIDGLSFEDFKSNRVLFYAVSRAIEIIGEAAKNIPDDVLEKYPEGMWRGVKGMRDIIAHEYARLDKELMWNVAVQRIPDLKRTILKMIKDIGP
jgi:uncharacterized protein with HEPN domain